MAEEETKEMIIPEGYSMPFDVTTGKMDIRTAGDLIFLCKIFAHTDMVPDSYRKKPDSIFVAAVTGFRVGFTDILMSLQSIAVVNGNPSIYGKGALGLIKRSKELTKHVECFVLPDGSQVDHYNGPADLDEWDDSITAVCEMTRGDGEPVRGMFSVADAKRMGKWNKPSKQGYRTVWMNHPTDMLMWRARHKVMDKDWSDVMCGLIPYEVAIDMEPIDENGGITYVPKGDTFELQDAPPEEAFKNGEQEQEVNAEGIADQFNTIFPPDTFVHMEEFVKLVADNSDQSVVQTHLEAMENVKDFGQSYGAWVAANKGDGNIPEVQNAPDDNYKKIQAFENKYDTTPGSSISTFLELLAQNSSQTIDQCMIDAMDDIEGFDKMFTQWDEAQAKTEAETGAVVGDPDPNESPFQEPPPAKINPDGTAEGYEPKETEVSKSKLKDTSKPEKKQPKESKPTGDDIYIQPKQGLTPFRSEWNLKNTKNYAGYVLKHKSLFERAAELAPKDYEHAKAKWEKFYPDKVWPIFPVDQTLEDEKTVKPVSPGMIRLFTDSDELNAEQKQYKMQHFYPVQFDDALKKLRFDNDNLGPAAINVLERVICDILKEEKKMS